jgi:hypothetical protein
MLIEGKSSLNLMKKSAHLSDGYTGRQPNVFDQGNCLSACIQHFNAVLKRDSADGHKWMSVQHCAGAANPVQSNRNIRYPLGGGRKYRPNSDVVDRHRGSDSDLLEIMSGVANDRFTAKQTPRSDWRHVILPEVNSVSLKRQRHVYPVIYYDFDPPAARDLHCDFRLTVKLERGKNLFS